MRSGSVLMNGWKLLIDIYDEERRAKAERVRSGAGADDSDWGEGDE